MLLEAAPRPCGSPSGARRSIWSVQRVAAPAVVRSSRALLISASAAGGSSPCRRADCRGISHCSGVPWPPTPARCGSCCSGNAQRLIRRWSLPSAPGCTAAALRCCPGPWWYRSPAGSEPAIHCPCWWRRLWWPLPEGRPSWLRHCSGAPVPRWGSTIWAAACVAPISTWLSLLSSAEIQSPGPCG